MKWQLLSCAAIPATPRSTVGAPEKEAIDSIVHGVCNCVDHRMPVHLEHGLQVKLPQNAPATSADVTNLHFVRAQDTAQVDPQTCHSQRRFH